MAMHTSLATRAMSVCRHRVISESGKSHRPFTSFSYARQGQFRHCWAHAEDRVAAGRHVARLSRANPISVVHLRSVHARAFRNPSGSCLLNAADRSAVLRICSGRRTITNGARQQPFKVLVIGGSYAGLAASLNLLDLCHGKSARFLPDSAPPAQKIPVEITLVDERDGFLHLISTPLAHVSDDFAPKAWVKFADVPALKAPGVRHLHGSVVAVDPAKKSATISKTGSDEQFDESYDYLVAGSGLKRAWPVVAQSLDRSSYLAEVGAHIESVKDAAREGVVVIGGGAVGIEMAAELKVVYPQLKVTLVHSRDRLLSSEPLPDTFKDRVVEVVRESGVETVLGKRVVETNPVAAADGSSHIQLTLSDGSHLTTGHVINAISKSVPTSSYLPKAVLDEEGYVKVHPSLRFQDSVPNAQYHFAAGDIVSWSGIRRCGGAMHMGQYVAENVHAHMLKEVAGVEPAWKELSEFPAVIGLAVGKKAVIYGPEEGTQDGEDLMKVYFGQDLGFQICWNYMQLGKDFVAKA